MTDEMHEPFGYNKLLWKVVICEDYNENETAIIFKCHHAMMDGLSGVHMCWSMCDNPT